MAYLTILCLCIYIYIHIYKYKISSMGWGTVGKKVLVKAL